MLAWLAYGLRSRASKKGRGSLRPRPCSSAGSLAKPSPQLVPSACCPPPCSATEERSASASLQDDNLSSVQPDGDVVRYAVNRYLCWACTSDCIGTTDQQHSLPVPAERLSAPR
jgi:hypothetical protein